MILIKKKKSKKEQEKKFRMERDHMGEHKVIEQKNGITVRLLRKPSPEYRAKLKRRADEDRKKREEKAVIKERERKIQEKMRELAIRELEKEGEL